MARMPELTPSQHACAVWYRDAERAFAERSYQRAHQWCMQILARDANYPDAFFLLALIAADHGNFAKAADVLGRAIRLDSATPRYHAHLGRCLIALNRQAEARTAARRAVSLGPNDALTLDTIGVVFSRTGDHGEAVPLFERATALDANNSSYFYNLGAALQFSGAFDHAQAAYRRAIGITPDLYRAWSSLVQLRRATPAANLVQELEAVFARLDDADARLHIGHALAKELEDLGDYPRAFDWLERAKEKKRHQTDYAASGDAGLFAAATATAKRRPTAAPRGHASTEPIFVLGMPRTGTTLVDRILSSHPDVFSAGELTDFALVVKRMSLTPSNRVLDVETLRAAAALDYESVGTNYLDSTRPRTGHTRHFIDKMPLNFFYAALIHAALPNARIICLRRNPLDTCLSNFRQLFATNYPYYDYAYDLLDTGGYYLQFHALIEQWRRTLPPERFMEVSYETLVADQEAQSRRLVAFCDLQWHAACLDFHVNAAPVATASAVQVRRPMYSSSIGRWQRYGARLDPLRALFDGAGISY